MLLVTSAMLMALVVLLHGSWQDWQRGEKNLNERTVAVARFYQTRQIMRTTSTEVLLQTLAQTPSVRGGASEKLSDFLRRLDVAQPDYLGFAVFDTEGQALAAVAGGQNFMALPAEEVRSHKYFTDALKIRSFSIGYGLESRSQPGRMYLPMTLPVLSAQDKVTSVLFAPLDMSLLSQEDMDSGLAALMQEHQMSVRLLDAKGRVLYQNLDGQSPGAQSSLGQELRGALWREAQQQPDDVLVLDEPCPEHLGTMTNVVLKLRLAPGQEAYAHVLVQSHRPSWFYFIITNYYKGLLAIVGSFLFALLVARLVGRYFFGLGLARLVRVAQRTQDGRMDMRCGQVRGCTEIQTLGRSVDNMLTEIQRSNRQLREQRERLDMALGAADMGVWRWDADTKTLHMDARGWGILGYNTLERDNHNALALIGAADVEVFQQALEEHIQGVSAEFSCAVRMRRQEGETSWIQLTGRRVLREKGADVQGVCLDVTARRRVEELEREQMEHYRKLSTTDGLTGLWNRRHFNESAHNEVLRCLRNGNSVAVIMTDIDFFKKVNDTYGHAAGDEVLRHFARTVKEAVRVTDMVARYGGEEFVLLLPETTLDEAILVAEKVRTAYAAHHALWEGAPIVSTASFGVCAYAPENVQMGYQGQKQAGNIVERLVALADGALYTSKQEGRNRVSACSAGDGVEL